MWGTTVAHLGGRVQSHVIEVAGFAGNPPVAGPIMPKLRDGLARYLRERKLKGAVLVGQMFGATVAYWLAMTEPDLVSGVVAIDTPPSRGEGEVDEEVEAMYRKLLSASPDEFKLGQKTRLRSCMADETIALKLTEQATRSSQATVADAFHDMMTRDLRAQIPRIKASVLLLLTTENFPVQARTLVEGAFGEQLSPIPHHQLVVIKGAHHYVMFDAPAAFFQQLDNFLDALRTGP
jgi:pimeloyl-ACP methyl ester carboxylesterase